MREEVHEDMIVDRGVDFRVDFMCPRDASNLGALIGVEMDQTSYKAMRRVRLLR